MSSNSELYFCLGKGYSTQLDAFLSYLSKLPNRSLPYMRFTMLYQNIAGEPVEAVSSDPHQLYERLFDIDINQVNLNLVACSICHTATKNILVLNINVKTGDIVSIKSVGDFEHDYQWAMMGQPPVEMFRNVDLGIVHGKDHIFFSSKISTPGYPFETEGLKLELIIAWSGDCKYSNLKRQALTSRLYTAINQSAKPKTRDKLARWKTLYHQEYLYGVLGDGEDLSNYKSFYGDPEFNSDNIKSLHPIIQAGIGKTAMAEFVAKVKQHTDTTVELLDRALKRMERL